MGPATRKKNSSSRSTTAVVVAVALLAVTSSAAAFDVQKCCPEGEMLGKNNVGCVALNATDRLSYTFVVPKRVNVSGVEGVYGAHEYTLRYGTPECENPVFEDPRLDVDEAFSITRNGHLMNAKGEVIDSRYNPFCLEMDQSFFLSAYLCAAGANGWCTPGESKSCPCEPDVYNKYCHRPTFLTVTRVLMIVSLPFLAATFVVYASFVELRNVHGKSLMCHVASLFFAYSTYMYNQYHTLTFESDGASIKLCALLAYTQQFAFIATFFWLNVMCFEIWWNFRKVTPKQSENKKFIIYSIYAWGCSISISIITYIMEEFVESDISPNFLRSSCWFHTSQARLLYFYGPIGVLLFGNLLMFILTLIEIIKHPVYAERFIGTERKKKIQKLENEKVLLSLKLFLVMGLNWTAEIWIKQGESFFWDVINFGNALQGVLIFIIFVCRLPVLRLLNKKICPQYTLVKPAADISDSVDRTDMQPQI